MTGTSRASVTWRGERMSKTHFDWECGMSARQLVDRRVDPSCGIEIKLESNEFVAEPTLYGDVDTRCRRGKVTNMCVRLCYIYFSLFVEEEESKKLEN